MRDTNSLQDEIRVSRSMISQQPLSKKLEYYWGYYKYYALIILILGIILGNILHGILTKKDTLLYIAYINAFPNVEDEVFIQDFENFIGLNPKKQEVILDSGYYINDGSASPYAANYHQKFSTRCMAGLVDVVVADETSFINYGKQGFFGDLRQILTPAQLEQYSSRLLYLEVNNGESAEMVPVGIEVTSAYKITSTNSYAGSAAYFGIVSGSFHEDLSLSYLSFLEQP